MKINVCLGLRIVGKAIYNHSCPRCGSSLVVLDLDKLFCENCGINLIGNSVSHTDVFINEIKNFVQFFIEVTGYNPWSLQKYWMKRLISGESFAMIAPTGVGKSTTLAVYALYKAYFYKSKIYIITPTREIAKQMYEKITKFLDKCRSNSNTLSNRTIRIILYDSTHKNVDIVKEEIKHGDFDILITSAAFLTRYKDLIMNKKVDVIIADDLDSIMKNSKSVDKVLLLLGFSNEDIELAQKIIKLRHHVFISKISKGQEISENLKKELLELEAYLRNNVARKNAQLVVASATGRIRGLKSLVLKLLLGFDGGGVFEYWRNIADLYYVLDTNLPDILVDIVKKLGSGVIFVSSFYKDMMHTTIEKLRQNGIKVDVAKSGNKAVDKFRKGEADVLIGSASYYGILVRGLDEPIKIRYTIFIGVPSIVKDVSESLNSVRFMYAVLRELKSLGYNVDLLINSVTEIVKNSTPSMLYLYSKLMKIDLSSKINDLSMDVIEKISKLQKIKENVYNILKELLNNIKVFELKGMGIITKKNSKYVFIKPDPYTYIQASGRCSRLYNGVKTFGVSIVIEEHINLVQILDKMLRRFVDNFSFKQLNINELDKYLEKIMESRKLIELKKDSIFNVSTALIIVESPTKAKTIANMFGRPAKRNMGNITVYETLIPLNNSKIYVATLMPTMGHLVDLVVDEGIYGVRADNNDYIPIYDFITKCRNCGSQNVGIYEYCPYCNSVNIVSSSSVYNLAKVLATQVDEVFLATDPDTEGEKIAYDIYNLLLAYNNNIYRVEFREITKSAILNALSNLRKIDMKKVEAQVARRIADRWIGFEVSLWLQANLGKPWLGAGRVQSPVLLWTSSRYREYKEYLGYVLLIDLGEYYVKMYVGKGLEAKEKASKLLHKVYEDGLDVKSLEFIEKEVSPPPPLTTDTLIHESNILFNFTASKTMSLAQSLFELGFITYHRTDSTRISSLGINIAYEILKKSNLKNLFTPRTWSSNADAEDAHEAIRPTAPLTSDELIELVMRGDIGFITRISDEHIKLYDLIVRRFVASQMQNSRIRYAKLKLALDCTVFEIEVPVEILFSGFTNIYPIKLYTNILNNIDKDNSKMKIVNAKIIRGSTVNLYKVADIVKLMKDKGIGRPSTYSKAIDNNIKHGYIITSKKRKYLIPTKLGLEVAEIINKKFLNLVGEETTKRLEELLDKIELNELNVNQIIEIIKRNIDTTIENVQSLNIDTPSTIHIPVTHTQQALIYT